jgi:hypothetical protein
LSGIIKKGSYTALTASRSRGAVREARAVSKPTLKSLRRLRRPQRQNRGPENGKNRDSDFNRNRAKYACRNARIAALNWLH